MRESSSRPSWSTPNQCADDGPGQQPFVISARFCSSGSYGAINGAKIATRTNIATKTKPTIAPRLWRSRRHASRQSPPVGVSSVKVCASISARLTRPGSAG